MKRIIHQIASMKIAIALLILIVIALATGTIIESLRGAEVAGLLVYDAAWFRLLAGLFALNVACSLVDLWPWGWQRAGFVLTHGSLLIVLVGALVTSMFKVEGKLALWEGEESAIFSETSRTGVPVSPRLLALPFSVRLDSFEIDYYQGTRRPAMFRSRVTVTDAAAGQTFPAVIEMNRELSYAGFKLFQSSYNQTPQRDQTVLSVSGDPGQPIVFAGYCLLMLGMMTVLATRMAQRRSAARKLESLRLKVLRRVAAVALALGLAAAASPPESLQAATLLSAESTDILRRLPVQHDGRVMPLDTLARETVKQVTGQYRFDGIDPVALVLGWSLDPDGWAARPIVLVGGGESSAAAGLPPGVRHVSFLDLVGNQRLMHLCQQARVASEKDQPLNRVLKDAQKIEERLMSMQGFLQGKSLLVIPDLNDPSGQWAPPRKLDSEADLLAISNDRPAAAVVTSEAMDREVTYNRVRPSRLAWWILLGATAATLLAWNLRQRWLDALAVGGLVAGFTAMTWGLAVRWMVAGRIPASNMYESLLFLGWGVGLFALIALIFLRNRLVILNATAMSALTMILADCLPMDPFIHPMPPVLSGTPWLAIHVPIIMVSYSVLALGVLIAHMQIGFEIFAPRRRDLVGRMNDMLYWYIHIGSILLIAGILTGSIWAASSWGRYWGWDPKEVWSLVAFLTYLAIVHGRFDRLIGTFGVAALSIIAFWTIIMTYVGVNFVLASGLHSYGFGSSAVVRWLLIVGAVEGLFLLAGLAAHTRGRQTASAV